MPTQDEMNRAVRQIAQDAKAAGVDAMKRARVLRKLGHIDAIGERDMIQDAVNRVGKPAGLDPAQFPHANRLKGQFA